MNCKHCQAKVSNYQQENLPIDEKNLIRMHLDECEMCQKFYAASKLIDGFVAKENQIKVNPFLATRVMAEIEQLQHKKQVKIIGTARVLKFQPLLVAASVIFAVFLGISAGSLIKPEIAANQTPEELMYLNDAAMESISIFIND